MNRFLELGINEHGHDFVIGDIHGRYTDLMRGLERVAFDRAKDRLFAVGDLIDRGDENLEVLGLIGEPWFYNVIGNHEVMMADALINGEHVVSLYSSNLKQFWVSNGGDWYFDLDNNQIQVLKDTYCPLFFEHLPVGIEFLAENGLRVGITHAGLPRAWTWDQVRMHLRDIYSIEDKAVKEMLWTRTRVNTTSKVYDIHGIDLLVNGHTPTPYPVWRGTNNVFIDLGAYNKHDMIPINVLDLLN